MWEAGVGNTTTDSNCRLKFDSGATFSHPPPSLVVTGWSLNIHLIITTFIAVFALSTSRMRISHDSLRRVSYTLSLSALRVFLAYYVV